MKGNDRLQSDNGYDHLDDSTKRQFKVHQRYEWFHILNDVMIATWFLIGSFFFFYESLVEAGTWLFVIGSAQMLIRPAIRIAHKLHVKDKLMNNSHFW
ncbi:YrhK-like protein [Scopulibacillus darangshiensis]|uniref:YrhK-like protein n=1 Tax=Scopulibacillus darangshiensis TaxID=442528 RepID=A0A4R2P3Z1_9BACL|nr:YrhK family protein [Scopulibacillus darangshiensis]TCP28764.1 YrhK-like protein [Scopulibacillus darangshiensis]